MDSQSTERDTPLPGRFRFALAVIVLQVAWGTWLLIRGASGYLVEGQWGQTFLLVANVVILIAKAQRSAADPQDEARPASRRSGISTPTVAAVLYLTAMLSYGFAFRHLWAEVAPSSTGAILLVALYSTLLGASWFDWRELR